MNIERGVFRIVDYHPEVMPDGWMALEVSTEKGWTFVSCFPPAVSIKIQERTLGWLLQDFQDMIAETLGELKEREEEQAQADGTTEAQATEIRSGYYAGLGVGGRAR